MQQLLQIFLEAAHHASIIPMASEATIFAMASFGNTDMAFPVAVAIIGAVIGHLFNLGIGRFLMRLPSSPKNHQVYLRIRHHFNRWGFITLALCFIPLGNVLVVGAGMLGTPMKKALPAIAAGLLYHYGQLLVQ